MLHYLGHHSGVPPPTPRGQGFLKVHSAPHIFSHIKLRISTPEPMHCICNASDSVGCSDSDHIINQRRCATADKAEGHGCHFE